MTHSVDTTVIARRHDGQTAQRPSQEDAVAYRRADRNFYDGYCRYLQLTRGIRDTPEPSGPVAPEGRSPMSPDKTMPVPTETSRQNPIGDKP